MENKIDKIKYVVYILFIIIFSYFIITDILNHKYINVLVDIIFAIIDILYLKTNFKRG